MKLRRLWLLIALVPSWSFAISVLPLNLEDLVDHADRIVVGTVDSVKFDRGNEKLWTADVVTINVLQTLKGTNETQISFRQLPHNLDLPRFFAGDRVVLFLPKPSAIGYASPVGLHQGVFKISGDSTDLNEAAVVNGVLNRFLTRNLKNQNSIGVFHRLGMLDRAQDLGHLKLRHLKELVTACNGSHP